MDEAGDDEDEVDRMEKHQHREEDEQPDEVDPQPDPIAPPVPTQGEHEQAPQRGGQGETGRGEPLGPGGEIENAEDETDGEGDVGRPLDHLVEAAFPPGQLGLQQLGAGFVAHSQRKVNAASTLAPIAKAAMTRRLEVEGARPDQVSCRA